MKCLLGFRDLIKFKKSSALCIPWFKCEMYVLQAYRDWLQAAARQSKLCLTHITAKKSDVLYCFAMPKRLLYAYALGALKEKVCLNFGRCTFKREYMLCG